MPIAWNLSLPAIRETVARFPVAAFLCLAVAAGMLGVEWPTWLLGVVESDDGGRPTGDYLDPSVLLAYDGRLLVLLLLALPVAVAPRILAETKERGYSAATVAATVTVLALALGILPSEAPSARLVPLLFGVWMLPFAVGPRGPSLWLFNASTSIAVIGGITFAVIAAIVFGLLMALVGVTFHLPGTLRVDVWRWLLVISTVILAPLLAMRAMPRAADIGEAAPPGLLGVVASLILVPALLTAALLLHLYLAQIPLSGSAPDRQVGWWSFAFGCALFAVWHVAWPLRAEGSAHVRWFYRFGLALLPLPLGMTAWALHGLVTSGGWTEWRIAGTMVAAWLATLVVLYAWRPHRLPLRLPIVTMAALLLLMALGPVSLTDLAAANQEARLRAALARGPDGDARLSAAARFLDSRDRLDLASDLVPMDVLAERSRGASRAKRFVEVLGRDYVPQGGRKPTLRQALLSFGSIEDERMLSVGGFDRVLADVIVETGGARALPLPDPSSAELLDGPPRLRIVVAGRALDLRFPEAPSASDVEVLTALPTEVDGPRVAVRLRSADLERVDGTLSGRIRVDLLVRLPPAP